MHSILQYKGEIGAGKSIEAHIGGTSRGTFERLGSASAGIIPGRTYLQMDGMHARDGKTAARSPCGDKVEVSRDLPLTGS
jgi:hypothetical protein